MKVHRIKASILHSLYHLTHSVETWVDLYWFALIDILVFGFISSFFVNSYEEASFLIAGIIVWEIVRVGQYTVTVGMLWEVWSRSFSSLFISPLTIWEFIAGQAISGLIKSLSVIIIVSLIAYFVFGFNLISLGSVFILYFFILFIFSIAAGIFVLSLIIRFGTNIQSLAWGLIFLVQPISAIFYPVEALPVAIQSISYLSPITYIMENIRMQLTSSTISWKYIGISFSLSIIYLLLSVLVAKRSLYHSIVTGEFARMCN